MFYGSNDVFPRKKVPSANKTIGDVISGKYAPKSPKSGREWANSSQTRKSKNRTISETVNAIKPKFDDIAATVNYTSWVVYH